MPSKCAPPDTNLLILAGQMPPVSTVVVVGPHSAAAGAKEVLGAALRSQVRKSTGVLSDLSK